MIKESDLYYIWQSPGFKHTFQEELNLHVLFCGKFSPHQGPDFQGARFELNGIHYAGDVEFHVKRKDWFLHDHHLDSRYDNVILHIVADQDVRPVKNSQNRPVRTLSFDKIIRQKRQKTDENCLVRSQSQNGFKHVLRGLSIQRLDEKCNRIRKLQYTLSLDNCLYYLILRAQGYVYNIKNFEILARKLPLSKIRSYKNCYNPPIEFWLCLYFGSAGFLPDRLMPGLLNEMWSQISNLLSVRSLQEYQWQQAGVRPGARPVRRLAVFAHFIHQLKGSLFEQFYSILYLRMEIRQTRQQLIDILKPHLSEYYKNNFYYPDWSWGDSFIIEIIGNIIIPVFLCWSIDSKSEGFSDYLLELYFSLPVPARYGITRKSKVLKNIKDTVISNFFEQQAILFLANNYCSKELCKICPFLHSHEK